MTPRALLTAIGATAIAFAVVVGSLATSGAAADGSVAAKTASVRTERSLAAAPRAWNGNCVTAL